MIIIRKESKDSRLFKEMSDEWKGALTNQKLIYFNHKYALDINVFLGNVGSSKINF